MHSDSDDHLNGGPVSLTHLNTEPIHTSEPIPWPNFTIEASYELIYDPNQ